MVRHGLSDQEVAHVIGVLLGGSLQSYVAIHVRRSRSVIHRAFTQFQETGHYSVLPRIDQSSVTTQTDDHFLVLPARRQQFVIAGRLQNDLQAATGLQVYTENVRNQLHEAGFHIRIPTIWIPLNHKQCQGRLNWAREHRGWTAFQWCHIMFSDGSKFCLDFNDGSRRVWRNHAECAAAEQPVVW